MTRGVLRGWSLMLVGVAAAGGCVSPDTALESGAGTVPVAGNPAPAPDASSNPKDPLVPVGGAIAPCGPVPFPSEGVAVAMKSAPGGIAPDMMLGAAVQAEVPPPPITGGTMLVTADGAMIVAADPARDQLYFLDAVGMQLLHTRQLNAGDQPGRLVEDAAGRIHVALRGGRSIATLAREADAVITRREVCAVPRGIAYDAARDELHVACAEGKLVSLAAAPDATATRQLELGADVRDVMVRGDQLFVTRFRSAELLVLDADGTLQQTRTPSTFTREEQRVVPNTDSQEQAQGQCSATDFRTENVHVEATPNVAWRAIDVPNAGVAMLHQRARTDEVQTTQGGYGSGSCGSGIVQTSITLGLDAEVPVSSDLADLTLAVDVAADPEGQLLAVVAPGNAGVFSQLQLLPITQFDWLKGGSGGGISSDAVPAASSSAATIVPGDPGTSPCMGGTPLPDPEGQATAVAFASPYVLAVQTLEPAGVSFYDVRTNQLRSRVDLGQPSRLDTGYQLFHMRAGAGVACASCHPEAGDDGHVWTFANIGPRRTQTLRGGLLGTEPLHWNGDMQDFGMLMQEVFVGRMSGFSTSIDQTDALAHWLDKQPALHADGVDALAVERGRLLFESEEVGCADCHAGPHLTNNESEDVGTGATLQVPSLKGLKFRTPLMHDGCAPTIAARFSDVRCGGGDDHGHVSQLSAAEISDLTAYLETL